LSLFLTNDPKKKTDKCLALCDLDCSVIEHCSYACPELVYGKSQVGNCTCECEVHGGIVLVVVTFATFLLLMAVAVVCFYAPSCALNKMYTSRYLAFETQAENDLDELQTQMDERRTEQEQSLLATGTALPPQSKPFLAQQQQQHHQGMTMPSDQPFSSPYGPGSYNAQAPPPRPQQNPFNNRVVPSAF
jgi:hypothetical protein